MIFYDTATTATHSFENWRNTLESLIEDELGLHLSDLPDQDYIALYEEDLTPRQAFDRCDFN